MGSFSSTHLSCMLKIDWRMIEDNFRWLELSFGCSKCKVLLRAHVAWSAGRHLNLISPCGVQF